MALDNASGPKILDDAPPTTFPPAKGTGVAAAIVILDANIFLRKYGEKVLFELLMDFSITSEDELVELVRSVVSVIIDDETMPAWSVASSQYYAALAKHICQHDHIVVNEIKRLAATLRGTYRNHTDHSYRVARIPFAKQRSCEENERETCCVCLRPLEYSWRKIVRLRSSNDDPNLCGHRLHKTCALKLDATEDGNVRCPMCRVSVGPFIRSWIDHESKVPQF